MVSASTSADNPAAITTYMITSLLQIFLISVTTADIPLSRHCSSVRSRISSMASSVSSADMEVSNVMIISWLPVSAFCRESLRSSGSISIGMEISASAPYHKTSLTWSISFNLSSNCVISFSCMPSMTATEKAPVPNSSNRISCPFIVSISPGRYERIS